MLQIETSSTFVCYNSHIHIIFLMLFSLCFTVCGHHVARQCTMYGRGSKFRAVFPEAWGHPHEWLFFFVIGTAVELYITLQQRIVHSPYLSEVGGRSR